MDTTDKRIELPDDLEDAIAQAKAATKAALEDGYRLIQVEIVYPELKAQPIAETFIPVLTEMGYTLKVMFPDTGAAALARRDWGDTPFKITDVGSRRLPVPVRWRRRMSAICWWNPRMWKSNRWRNWPTKPAIAGNPPPPPPRKCRHRWHWLRRPPVTGTLPEQNHLMLLCSSSPRWGPVTDLSLTLDCLELKRG